ncbi:MAG TPA: general stress protein [Ktedonobacterales bacterium]|nr:general stress protein [Ktedonobacterales bacterium]
MPTVIGMFREASDVDRAINELTKEGFQKSQIGVVARHEVLKAGGLDVTSGAEVGAITGATTGGIAGLLIGMGALVIPGLQIVAAASFLVAVGATVLGLAAGAVGGGLVGALAGFGIEESRAQRYAAGVSEGHILVTVQTPDRSELAAAIMTNYNAVEVDSGGAEVPPMPSSTSLNPEITQ